MFFFKTGAAFTCRGEQFTSHAEAKVFDKDPSLPFFASGSSKTGPMVAAQHEPTEEERTALSLL